MARLTIEYTAPATGRPVKVRSNLSMTELLELRHERPTVVVNDGARDIPNLKGRMGMLGALFHEMLESREWHAAVDVFMTEKRIERTAENLAFYRCEPEPAKHFNPEENGLKRERKLTRRTAQQVSTDLKWENDRLRRELNRLKARAAAEKKARG